MSQILCKRLVLEENNRNLEEQVFASILDAEHLNRDSVLVMPQTGSVLALVSTDRISDEDLKVVLKRIIENADRKQHICLKAGIGSSVEYLEDVKSSRREAAEAVKVQTEKYFHTIFNVYVHDGYVSLAEKLNEIMPCKGDVKKTYFANSGAEFDENAIKIAKEFTKRNGVICFTGAFHGRTNLTMALTAKKVYAVGMGPFPAGIYRAPYPYLYRAPKGYTEAEAIQYYIDELNRIFDEGAPASEISCMIVEPFQGEGGFIPAPIEWVKAVRKICDDNGILMIADEVQCGNCRTGKYYASEYWAEEGAAHDIITTAKSLGAMIGVEFVKDRETKEPATKLVADLIQNAIQKGLLLESCGTASNTVRFLAPLTMTDEQMERGLEIFEEALKEALDSGYDY